MNQHKTIKLTFTVADLKQQPGMAVVTDVKAGMKINKEELEPHN